MWPARISLDGRPSSVRATTLSSTRSTSKPRHRPQPRSTWSAMARFVVADRGDVDQLGRGGQQVGHTETPCSRSSSFSWAVSWRRPSSRRRMTRMQGRPNSPPAKSTGPGRPTPTIHAGTTPRDSSSPVSASMTGMPGLRMHPPRGPRPSPDPGALGDHRPAADEGVVLHDHRGGLGRLEDTADPYPAGQVDVGADLGAGAHGGPGVDHGAGADPGADVDVARHHDDARLEEAAPAGRRAGHHPDARPRRNRASGAACRRTRRARPRRSPWPRSGKEAGWPASATRGRSRRRPHRPQRPGPGPDRASSIACVDVGTGVGVPGLELGPAVPMCADARLQIGHGWGT